MSIVRSNLLTQRGYTPYCGGESCTAIIRTRFDGKQFVARCCTWRSQFEPEFIAQYIEAQKKLEHVK